MSAPARLEPAKIARLDPITPRAYLVRLEGVSPATTDTYRLPGMEIGLAAGDAAPVLIGLASQPGKPFFEVLVERGTPLAGSLEKAGVGGEVQVSAPAGTGFPTFEFRRNDLYVVGHGAGLGPCRAVILHALTERGAFDRVRLLAEARYVDEIPFREDFPAWQRADVRIYQVLARPDMGKWKRGEGAYVGELLAELAPSAAKSAVFASGPADMLRGLQGALRKAGIPAERFYAHELLTTIPERPRDADRKPEDLAKITAEGFYGSGHQKDAPDHAPGFRTPAEQPRGSGLAPYQRAKQGEAHRH